MGAAGNAGGGAGAVPAVFAFLGANKDLNLEDAGGLAAVVAVAAAELFTGAVTFGFIAVDALAGVDPVVAVLTGVTVTLAPVCFFVKMKRIKRTAIIITAITTAKIMSGIIMSERSMLDVWLFAV